MFGTWPLRMICSSRLIRSHVRFAAFFLAAFFLASLSATGWAADRELQGVQFDVPILCTARPLVSQGIHPPAHASLKLVEVSIPVSPQIDRKIRGDVDEFEFEIHWNRNVYPLVTYAPKTQTTSEIKGLIEVQKRHEKNAAVSLNLKGGYETLLAATDANLGTKTTRTSNFQQIPQHHLLVASGTIQRGTGAFFRFHPSRTEALEGGRELVVVFRVPQAWRGGILQVNCRAQGQKRVAGIFREAIESEQSFVMPIFLEGDEHARQVATEFVRSQIGLGRHWKQQSSEAPPANSFKADFEKLMLGRRQNHQQKLPPELADQLILSGVDHVYQEYRDRMDSTTRAAANRFIAARKEMDKLSR